MNENIQKMLELLSQDEETMAKLYIIRDPDEAYALVTSIHGGYTKEEFIETMTAINDSINQDISSDDLNKVAGGRTKEQIKRTAENGAIGTGIATAISSVFSSVSYAGFVGGLLSAAGSAAASAAGASAGAAV